MPGDDLADSASGTVILQFIIKRRQGKRKKRRVRIRNVSKKGFTLFVNNALSCAQDIQTLLIGQLIIKFVRLAISAIAFLTIQKLLDDWCSEIAFLRYEINKCRHLFRK